MDWAKGRQGKKKKNKARNTFALPSITIMCTYDFGGVGGFILAPFSILEKRGGLVSLGLLKPIGLGFRVFRV
jgi:hypothetical protein